MNFDIPLHYLQSPNEDPKVETNLGIHYSKKIIVQEFQKKVVGMDWGHVEPPKV